MALWEDVFQVYRRIGKDYVSLMASDMSAENAALFAKAWLQQYYMDQKSSIEIRRQSVDYIPELARQE